MPAVNTTYTFQDSDVITSVKMNNIIDQTTFVASGISGQTLEVTTSGQLKVRSQNITSNELASNAVTTTKITDGSVTPAKLSTGAPSWDTAGSVVIDEGSVTIGSGAVTIGSGAVTIGSGAVTLGVSGSATSMTRSDGIDGAFAVVNEGDGGIDFSSSGPISFNGTTVLNQDGAAPIYGARAWGYFKTGPNLLDTARLATGNIAGISRTSEGRYTITLSQAVPTNSAFLFTCSDSGDYLFATVKSSSTTSVSIEVRNAGNNAKRSR
jgi:hypothetical protein